MSSKQRTADFLVYSDGGSSNGKGAAGACIVEDSEGKVLARIVGYIGNGTNNEGEILGGLLGFSWIKASMKTNPIAVTWVSDSEYTLKSATLYISNWQKNGWKTSTKEPVKNQGLWRSYLELTKNITVHSQHVKGHSGHPQNEACDGAVLWIRNKADEIGYQKQSFEKFCSLSHNKRWFMLDCRKIIKNLRVEHLSIPDNDSIYAISELLKKRLENNHRVIS